MRKLIYVLKQPAKTPKTTTKLKLTTPKTPTEGTGKKATGASKSKQSTSAKKGGKAASDEDADDTGAETKEPEKPIDPQELKNKREKEGMSIYCFKWIKQQANLGSSVHPPQASERLHLSRLAAQCGGNVGYVKLYLQAGKLW